MSKPSFVCTIDITASAERHGTRSSICGAMSKRTLETLADWESSCAHVMTCLTLTHDALRPGAGQASRNSFHI